MGSWEKRVWLGVGIGLGLSGVGLFSLVGYSLWQTLSWLHRPSAPSEQYVLNAVALTTLGILRYLAMLVGAALASGGLLVSFLTLSQAIGVTASAGGATPLAGALKTTSPGVAAIVIGSLVIVASLFARTEFQLNYAPTSAGGSPSAGSALPMPPIDQIRKSLPAPDAPASGGQR